MVVVSGGGSAFGLDRSHFGCLLREPDPQPYRVVGGTTGPAGDRRHQVWMLPNMQAAIAFLSTWWECEFGVTDAVQADLQFLKELIEAGTVTLVIHQTYSLSEVPEAMRYLEQGHARPKVVIAV
jgi:NADPH:quinone reductase-like Zn-dependent oxidoreductase